MFKAPDPPPVPAPIPPPIQPQQAKPKKTSAYQSFISSAAAAQASEGVRSQGKTLLGQ